MKSDPAPRRTKRVHPFANDDRYTQFDNYVLDEIMPKLKPNAWKVLCFVMRRTRGWVDQNTGKRRESDALSYSQIQEGTGIKHPNTVNTALQELRDMGCILVEGQGKWDANRYRLNSALEIEVEDNSPTSKSESDTTSENAVGSTSKNEDTKEREKEKEKKNVAEQSDIVQALGVLNSALAPAARLKPYQFRRAVQRCGEKNVTPQKLQELWVWCQSRDKPVGALLDALEGDYEPCQTGFRVIQGGGSGGSPGRMYRTNPVTGQKEVFIPNSGWGLAS